MDNFKKGGKLQNSNILATNRLFVKNPLFKKKKKKRAPGVYNPKAKFRYEDGGSVMNLSEDEIQKYIDGGYIVEEVNDPSIPALTKAAKGGTKKGCPEGHYWDGKKCTKLITLKNDKKYIDGVANWAMHVSDPNMISGNYNDQIKDKLYSGNWGLDPETGALVKLSAVQPKSVTTVDAKTKASREKEKLAEKNYKAEEENKKAYEQSIIGAGFDPATFGKAKGINTITGEPIYASSKEEAERINQEAINQAAIEGHAAVVNNPVFKTAANFTPIGMAVGAVEGLARFIPDAYTLAQNPSWAAAGQLGMDALQAAPVIGKPLSAVTGKAFYKSKNTGTNTSTGLTDADVAAARAEEEAWLTSDEYLKRRMKNTGESSKAVREDVAKILKRADKANYNVNADLKGAHGEMATNIFINPKVSVSKTAPNPNKVLRHENIHLYSPASAKKTLFSKDLHKNWENPNVAELKASERGVYANYPTIGDSPESIMYANDPSAYNYNMLGYEQQARHLGAMRDIAAKNNVDINAGKKLTEKQVRSHIDDFIKNRENVDYDYDEIWGAEILNERKKLADAFGAPLDEIKKIDPDKYKEIINVSKDNAAKRITKVLNNAWVVAPTAGVAGTATMLANPFQGSDGLKQQKKGGSTNDYIEVDIPEDQIQWYIDQGYRVEPATKLKKFIG